MKTKSKSTLIHSTPQKVFARMDDFSKMGMHMSESSMMMMMGSKLKCASTGGNGYLFYFSQAFYTRRCTLHKTNFFIYQRTYNPLTGWLQKVFWVMGSLFSPFPWLIVLFSRFTDNKFKHG